VFGFEELMVSDYWSELKWGDAIVAFHGGYPGGRNPVPLTLEFDDIMEAVDQISAAGGTILEAPKQREGEPILLGTFRDPEGNELFMTQYIG
jgi:predicted enzyme related to lactoylglutathione lyase